MVRRSLHTEDSGREAELTGEAVGAGTLSRVWEGLSEGVTGCTPPNPELRGKRGGRAGGRQGK